MITITRLLETKVPNGRYCEIANGICKHSKIYSAPDTRYWCDFFKSPLYKDRYGAVLKCIKCRDAIEEVYGHKNEKPDG